MQRFCMIVVLAAVWMEMSAATVSAQLFPARRYRGSYDGLDYYDAAVGALALGSADSATRGVAQNYQAWRQQAAAPQMSATQSGIQNAMSADAQRRTEAIYSQQQSNRDWWFQTQQQQIAQRQAAATQMEAAQLVADSAQRQSQGTQYQPQGMQYETSPAAPGFESETKFVPPPVAMDVIPWSPVLRFPRFAEQRARIEAPYRRSSKGLSTPTAKDYQDMIDATEKMKTILKGLVDIISAQDYFNTEAFLNQLASEARTRLKEVTPKK